MTRTQDTDPSGAPAVAVAVALGEAPRRQARNSAAFWAATGRSRGHAVIRRRGFLAVTGDERTGSRVLIDGFELSGFEPHRPGEVFPMALLREPGVEMFVARLDGEVAGACVTVVEDGFGGHYWVGTPPKYRSRGVGRAVMVGSLAPLAGMPVTLTASNLGRPLYESLGFATAGTSTWWAGS